MRLSHLLIGASLLLLAAMAHAQGCCSPPQWSSKALTINSLGQTSHSIYYDTVRKWVRWDRSGNIERAGVDQTLITWTDYNKLVEYVYWPETGLCEPYGPDDFYPWCFGPSISQTKVTGLTVGIQKATLWQSQFSDVFQWTSLDDFCLPLSTSKVGFFTTNFFNTTIAAPPSSIWDLPSACTKSNVKRGTSFSKPIELRP